MNFDLDSDQLQLRESLQRFFSGEHSFERRRTFLATDHGYNPGLWHALADQGVLALGLPEAHGGFGGPVEVMVAMEEIGRSLCVEPFLSTVVLCGSLIAERGNPAQQEQLLPRIISGEAILALAHHESQARYGMDCLRTSARFEGGAFVLNGTKRVALGGAAANHFLVSARRDDNSGTALFLVDSTSPGVDRIAYRTHDGGNAADLNLRDVRVGSESLLGETGDASADLAHAVERAIAALCAEAVGIMEALNHATIEYLKSRRQFGQPIGRFQALQHRTAEMFMLATQARSMSLLATGRCSTRDAALRARDISAAKAFVGKAARVIGQEAVQLHGGMGMADELPVSHYFKRLTMINATFGDVDHHLGVVSDAIAREAAVA